MSEHSDRAHTRGYSDRGRPAWVPTRAEVALGLSGVIAGIIAALYTFARVSSWWVALFVFVVISHTVGRGLSEVMAKPHRLAHLVYFALFPVVGTAILYIAYDLWGKLWLAVLLGLVFGGIFQVTLGASVLPERAHTDVTTAVTTDVTTEVKGEKGMTAHADNSRAG